MMDGGVTRRQILVESSCDNGSSGDTEVIDIGSSDSMNSEKGRMHLYETIYRQDWDKASEMLSNKDSTVTTDYLDQYERTSLHWACAKDAPISVVKMLISANVDSLNMTDKAGKLPLNLALEHASDDLVILMIEKTSTETVCSFHDSGHAGDARMPIIEVILYRRSTNVLHSLIQKYPKQLLIQDSRGHTPVVTFFRMYMGMMIANVNGTDETNIDPEDVIGVASLLLSSEKIAKTAGSIPKNTMQIDPLTIHHALNSNNCPFAFIQFLLKHHPEQVDVEDDNGDSPLTVIAVRAALKEIQLNASLFQCDLSGYRPKFEDECFAYRKPEMISEQILCRKAISAAKMKYYERTCYGDKAQESQDLLVDVSIRGDNYNLARMPMSNGMSSENDRSSVSDVAQQVIINTQSAVANLLQTTSSQLSRVNKSKSKLGDISFNTSTTGGKIEEALLTVRSESSRTMIESDNSNKLSTKRRGKTSGDSVSNGESIASRSQRTFDKLVENTSIHVERAKEAINQLLEDSMKPSRDIANLNSFSSEISASIDCVSKDPSNSNILVNDSAALYAVSSDPAQTLLSTSASQYTKSEIDEIKEAFFAVVSCGYPELNCTDRTDYNNTRKVDSQLSAEWLSYDKVYSNRTRSTLSNAASKVTTDSFIHPVKEPSCINPLTNPFKCAQPDDITDSIMSTSINELNIILNSTDGDEEKDDISDLTERKDDNQCQPLNNNNDDAKIAKVLIDKVDEDEGKSFNSYNEEAKVLNDNANITNTFNNLTRKARSYSSSNSQLSLRKDVRAVLSI